MQNAESFENGISPLPPIYTENPRKYTTEVYGFVIETVRIFCNI